MYKILPPQPPFHQISNSNRHLYPSNNAPVSPCNPLPLHQEHHYRPTPPYSLPTSTVSFTRRFIPLIGVCSWDSSSGVGEFSADELRLKSGPPCSPFASSKKSWSSPFVSWSATTVVGPSPSGWTNAVVNAPPGVPDRRQVKGFTKY